MSASSSPGLHAFWNPPTWAIMGLALCGVLWLGLAPPAVAALVMFCLILFTRRLLVIRFTDSSPFWATLICGFLAVTAVLLAGFGVSALLDTDTGIPAMTTSLKSSLLLLRESLPSSVSNVLPASPESLTAAAVDWLQKHVSTLTTFGVRITKLGFHLVIGLLVGTLAAHAWMVRPPNPRAGGLVDRMLTHLSRFRVCFERVVFAQVYIAATNAIFTGIFLAIAMPILGFSMPYVKTLIALTFILGLIPILGNIASNILICAVALTLSPVAAAISLAFLVGIHKLEYFLNAWIMGSRIKVQSYEILGSMLILEAMFGLWGLILAPVFYSYLKEEIRVSESQGDVNLQMNRGAGE